MSLTRLELPRLRDCTWVLGGEAPLADWLAEQIGALSRSACGASPPVVRGREGAASPGTTIAVGSPDDCALVAAAEAEGRIELAALGPEDFGIRRANVAGGDVWLVYGHELRTASYGVFHLFEQLGCRFLVSRDVVPGVDGELRLPAAEGVFRTDNKWRGIWFQYCFATNSSMSLADYASLFDQLAKLRLNRVVFYHFENEPFVDFSFRGERKIVGDISHPESGYISYGRHFSGSYRVADVAIGAERFGRERVAPLELQGVSSSAEALDAARAFMQRVMGLARQRGLACWLSFLPQFIPLNLLKYARRMPRPHLHWSGLVSAADPVVDQINRARLQAIWEAYPDLEGILLGIPEGYYEDPYEDSRRLVDEHRPEYERAYQLHRELWGAYWNHNEALLEQHIRQDIGFAEILQRTVRIARELRPDCRLGVLTVCKAYLLTHLHTLLPEDVVFADIESRSLWTLDGAPLHLFREMAGRECAIIPRAVDDGSMAGMQFDLELYARDRYLHSARENGTAGLIVQTTHVRGNEHNMGFLAAGMWDAELTPEGYYRDYCERLFGGAAGPLEQAQSLYEQAAQRVAAGDVPHTPAGAGAELAYLKARNTGYIHHLKCLVELGCVYERLREVLGSPAPVGETRAGMGQVLEMARRAGAQAEASALAFSECAEHATDLGVLWMVNSSMVTGARVLLQHLGNVKAYHDGEEYWKPVEWDRLFGTCPHPAYGMDTLAPTPLGNGEPG